ncbi:MAG: Outer membrane lipoprotein-sorting protein [Candidatus Accumulibacter appositus]|uniref:Outer membrane lipoprotein-sorting protein n=1 Tax=Candidatus Accumulibacter appositus TaxID=1454003 RepID=A0A011QM11_9PROT|nr:DUF2092 domain-containing protein [Accumulibacter sp.]EXI79894.1 MAG: Outer membrane lipoprotein-sorting protein [Candidatus Accumulibacter appositus]HRF05458.1 DUF2092 domain-containing protein [Accumulibacter sp.]
MNSDARKTATSAGRSVPALALSIALGLGVSASVSADELDAKRLVKAMSEFLAAQQALSFSYDATLEVVTPDAQILGLASSGKVVVNRPDKIHATRAGGFADVAMSFDGKTLTILGKNLNAYTQVEIPGSIDHLVDVMRDKYDRPLPAADLLLTNSYEMLMEGVEDIKDLGSGVIGGVECDSLAFRSKDVDWQIWIAHGDKPYPCRYTITSKSVPNGPSYSIQFSDWKVGKAVTAASFAFKNTSKATQVKLEDLKGTGDLPEHFTKGASK